MAGIYLHIPFCNRACHYCDFHFSTNQKYTGEMTRAMVSEIHLRASEWKSEQIKTIYFGGGTPSTLPAQQIGLLMDAMHAKLNAHGVEEITLEANPEDLTTSKISDIQHMGVNRLSIGIQSFHDHHLTWMNRAHTGKDAERAVKTAQDKGITNITIDLIYSIPNMTRAEWLANLDLAIQLDVPHISAYSLTIEPQTVFGHQHNKGQLQPAPDAESEWQYLTMVDVLNRHGIQSYEVSNFAKSKMESKHNSAYWKGASYLGIGPSAHSYTHPNRSWNIANNAQYMKALSEGFRLHEEEILTAADQYNETIMTRLRTARGLNIHEVEETFGVNVLKEFEGEINEWIRREWAQIEGDQLHLQPKGMLFADRCAAELFLQQQDFA
jgi:oxygen-independent coproporphyrinogen-3 oxidase